MNNLSQLLAFVNGARHVGLYILSSPDLSLCLAGWPELVLVIVNTRRGIKINESSNSEWKKKSLGRDREGKRGWPESSHLLRFERKKKGKSERDFVCLFWGFPSPIPSMSCAMTNSRVRQQPSRRLSSRAIFTYALLVFLEHFFFLSGRRACVWFMRREANLKSPLTPLSNAPLFFSPPSSYSIRRDNIDSRLSLMKLFGRERETTTRTRRSRVTRFAHCKSYPGPHLQESTHNIAPLFFLYFPGSLLPILLMINHQLNCLYQVGRSAFTV